MDLWLVGLLGIVFLFVLLACKIPIGISMAVVGILGIAFTVGWKAALPSLAATAYSKTANWSFSVIPMFILMGNLAFLLDFGQNAFDMASKWMNKMPGSLAMTTLLAGGIFGACCGSSLASTITLGKLSLPEMDKLGYSKGLAAGTVASAGTLAALIPPSITAVLYAITADVSVGKLIIAIVFPGILLLLLYIALVLVRCLINPKLATSVNIEVTWKERFSSLTKGLPILLIFVGVFGGLFVGVFTPTEAGAVGAFITALLGFVFRRKVWANYKSAVNDSAKTTCAIFIIIIGASLLVQFLSLSRLPVILSQWVISTSAQPLVILAALTIVVLILGCFLDAIGVLMLTMPFVVPTMRAVGIDLLWFGVIMVELLEIGLLTPPVALQGYAIKAIDPTLSWKDIFGGCVPFFLVALFVWVPLLVAFPIIALWLPSFM